MTRKKPTVLDTLVEYEYVIMELSRQTQIWYMARLRRFQQWCAKNRLHLQEIRPAHVNMYLQQLREPSDRTGKPLSTYTLHGHMRCIRTFLYWCAKEPQRYIDKAVPDNVVMPKVDQKVIQALSREQFLALQVAAGQNYFKAMAARDNAILAVLMDTGVRASENYAA